MNQRQQLLEQIRRESVQKRAQALREAAQRQAFNAPIAAAGATGSGSGGRGGCLPAGGVMMTLNLAGESTVGFARLFLYPAGTTMNGEPVYIASASFDEEGKGFVFYVEFQISWSGTRWELKSIEREDDVVVFEDLLSYSEELYSTNWTNVGEFIDVPIEGSVPGEEFDCSWRYCLVEEEDYGFVGTVPAAPYWIGIGLDQFPNAFAGIADSKFIIWDETETSWTTTDSFDNAVLLGGSREQLPTGTFDLGGGSLFTIQQGVCGFQ